jgi:hypothetical protein
MQAEKRVSIEEEKWRTQGDSNYCRLWFEEFYLAIGRDDSHRLLK